MTKHFPVINGLRGVAILGVFYTHFFWNLTPLGWHQIHIGDLTLTPFTLLSNGHQAVDLFFVLSGLVLALPYAHGTRSMTSLRDMLGFYRRRSRRLLPLLLVTIIVSVILHSGLDPERGWSAFLDIAKGTLRPFPQTWVQFLPTYNFVLWSLRVELWLSLLLPLLLVSIRLIGAPALALGTLAFGTALRVYAAVHWYEGGHFLSGSFLGRLDIFVMGMALAFVLRREHGILARPVSLLAGIGMVMASFWLTDMQELRHLEILHPFQMAALGIGFTLIVGSVMTKRSTVSRLLCSPLLQIPGILCYSLYLWHGILFNIMTPAVHRENTPAFFVVLSLLTVISYLTLENGSFRRLRKTFQREGAEPIRMTSSSTNPDEENVSHVTEPPSTSSEETPWKSPAGVISA